MPQNQDHEVEIIRTRCKKTVVKLCTLHSQRTFGGVCFIIGKPVPSCKCYLP